MPAEKRATSESSPNACITSQGELTATLSAPNRVTLPVSLQLELHGFLPESPFGDTRVGFTATGEINRDDFGITFNSVLESGGVALGNKVQVMLEIEAVRRDG